MRRAFSVCLLLACAHQRAEPAEGVGTAAEPTPIATRLKVPDAGPFDFSQRPEEEKKWTVSGDMAHPGQMSGYR